MFVKIPFTADCEKFLNIEISDFCPLCKQLGQTTKRGKPTFVQNIKKDKRYHVWNNKCGHVDYFSKMLEEEIPESILTFLKDWIIFHTQILKPKR